MQCNRYTCNNSKSFVNFLNQTACLDVSILNVPHLVLAMVSPSPCLDLCSWVSVVVHDVEHQAGVLADDVVLVHPPVLVLPPMLVISAHSCSWAW